jgi:hypothetical protein
MAKGSQYGASSGCPGFKTPCTTSGCTASNPGEAAQHSAGCCTVPQNANGKCSDGRDPPGTPDLYSETTEGGTSYVYSFGGTLNQGIISVQWRTEDSVLVADIGPYLDSVDAREDAGGAGFGPILARVETTNTSTGLADDLDSSTYLYGLVICEAPTGTPEFNEISNRPFGLSATTAMAYNQLNDTLEEETTRYSDEELEYLYETLGYSFIDTLNEDRYVSTKLDDLLAKVGTSDIANQVLNNVVDYGKIRASQITTISKQEAGQTISILPGNTSTY